MLQMSKGSKVGGNPYSVSTNGSGPSYIYNTNSVVNGVTHTIRGLKMIEEVYFYWEPKKDITTYELALATPHIHKGRIGLDEYMGTPVEVTRHFKLDSQSEAKVNKEKLKEFLNDDKDDTGTDTIT